MPQTRLFLTTTGAKPQHIASTTLARTQPLVTQPATTSVRTPRKWYIKEVKLLPAGRREARKCLGEQQALPLHLRKEK